MVNGSEIFFRSNLDSFTFQDHTLFIKGNYRRSPAQPHSRTSIMSEFLAKNLLGNMPLVPTNKLFKSPSGLIFECSGIVRAVPIEINKTEVHLDFHIFAILDFDLVIGYPFEKTFQEKRTHGSLNKETAFASCLESPMEATSLPITHSRRRSSYPHSFHLSFLVKWNVHHQTHSNLRHVP